MGESGRERQTDREREGRTGPNVIKLFTAVIYELS